MKNLFIFVIVLLSVACTRNYDTTVVIDSEDCVTSSYSLKEQAKQSVQEMLNKLDPPTRGFARTVASVEVITYGELFGEDARTRTDSIGWNPRPIQRYYRPALLLTNFTNNSGFAVLQPLFDEDDMAVEDWENPSSLKYIAITDSGAMTSAELISYGNDYTSEETITPAELYIEAEDDFYIGNTEPQKLIASLVLSYTHRKENDPLYDLPNLDDTIDYAEVDEVAEEQVGPLLQTIWHQGIPFNAYVQTYDDGQRCPLGCTTIAAGQILTYLKNRSLFSYFGIYTSQWINIENEDFTQYDSYNNLSTAADNTAKMLKQIADGIGVLYNFLGGTFAFPKQVQRYLENSLDYDIDRQIGGRKAKRLKNIVNSLNDNKPVFMAGLGDLKEGHAWVVDGYISNEDSTTAKHDFLIHCNFGWGGSNNGWYLIDTITSNLNDDDLLDEGVSEQSMRYNWAFRYLFFE